MATGDAVQLGPAAQEYEHEKEVAQREGVNPQTSAGQRAMQAQGVAPPNQAPPPRVNDLPDWISSKLSPAAKDAYNSGQDLGSALKIMEQEQPKTAAPAAAPSDTSGIENNAAANAAKTSGTSPTGQPMFDPLAINAFYATGIAPMLQQLQTNLGSENALYTQMAQGIANKYAGSLPPGYQQAMAGTIPQMGAAQNDVIASLMGAQLSGSGLDQLMNNLNANQTAQEAAYRQLLSNPTLSSLGQAAGALPGGVPAQTNTIPAFTLPATPGSDPLATNNVLPGQ